MLIKQLKKKIITQFMQKFTLVQIPLSDGQQTKFLGAGLWMFESIRLGSMDFELRFKDAIEQMSTRK